MRAWRLFYATHSRILYGYKHFGRPSAIVLMAAALLVEPIVRVAGALASGAGSQAAETARAYGLLWRRAPSFLKLAVGRSQFPTGHTGPV